MSLKYLLDTNVVSEPLRPKPATAILRRLRCHEGETAIASIVWHELQFGFERLVESRRRAAIKRYLEEVVEASFPILDYDRSAAEWHARERARLEAERLHPSWMVRSRRSRVSMTWCSSPPTKPTSLSLKGYRSKVGSRPTSVHKCFDVLMWD